MSLSPRFFAGPASTKVSFPSLVSGSSRKSPSPQEEVAAAIAAASEEESLDDPDFSATAPGPLSRVVLVRVRRPRGAAVAPSAPTAAPVQVLPMAGGDRVLASRAAPVGVVPLLGAAVAPGAGHAGGEPGPPGLQPHPLEDGSSSQSSCDSIEEVLHTSTTTLAGRVAWRGYFATSRYINDQPPYSSST